MNGMGGCDMEFEGDNALLVAGMCGNHVMATTDEAHKPNRDQMKEQMTNGTKEEQEKWFLWFKGLWDAK